MPSYVAYFAPTFDKNQQRKKKRETKGERKSSRHLAVTADSLDKIICGQAGVMAADSNCATQT
jgi:hypothetical protein